MKASKNYENKAIIYIIIVNSEAEGCMPVYINFYKHTHINGWGFLVFSPQIKAEHIGNIFFQMGFGCSRVDKENDKGKER